MARSVAPSRDSAPVLCGPIVIRPVKPAPGRSCLSLVPASSEVVRHRSRQASLRRPCREFSQGIQVHQALKRPNFSLRSSLMSLSESPLRRCPHSSPSCSPRCSVRSSPRRSDRCGLSSSLHCSPGCCPGCGLSSCPRCSLHRSTRCSTGCSDRCRLSRRPRSSPRSSDPCSTGCSVNCFWSCSPRCSADSSTCRSTRRSIRCGSRPGQTCREG